MNRELSSSITDEAIRETTREIAGFRNFGNHQGFPVLSGRKAPSDMS